MVGGQEGRTKIVVKNHPLLRDVFALLLLTALGLAIAGYHPGCEDDGVYLSRHQTRSGARAVPS